MNESLPVIGGCCAPSGGWTLRAARAADRVSVGALLREATLGEEDLDRAFPGGYVVAESGGRIAGVAGIERYGPHALLRSVAVAAPSRGMGVGEALVHDRLAAAEREGAEDVWLLTTTAERWFPRFGFTPAARATMPEPLQASAEVGHACPASAAVLRRAAAGAGDEALRAQVRAHYGRAARDAAAGGAACCGPQGKAKPWNPITSDLYREAELTGVPHAAILASLGCGNPTALAELRAGEVVLDLGSGGGIDVLLSAKRVGPAGRAIGLDMTDEMLALAEENRRAAGVENATFLRGTMEAIPLPPASVDVVISNCVINLSADKRAVLAETFRVLKPGGRFAVSDIVTRGPLPASLQRHAEAWSGCVAGALDEALYRRLLQEAGFREVEVEATRVYTAQDAASLVEGLTAEDAGALDGVLMSAFVRATRPA
ncbi:MAG TPA: arsenite methyltransferase [Candidatus Polarisedimenticolaceae bacterium]|nr:arsenite methyltransferase [Candidatus Polarisedimenticolaceae bacterium]